MNQAQATKIAKEAGLKVTAVKATPGAVKVAPCCDAPREFMVGTSKLSHAGVGGFQFWDVDGARVGAISDAILAAVAKQAK